MGSISLNLPQKGLKTLRNLPRISAANRSRARSQRHSRGVFGGALSLVGCGVADSRHASL